MGQDIVFSSETCKCYDDILQTFARQASTQTLKRMNALSEKDFVNLIARLWVELEQEFDMHTELSAALQNIDWQAEIAKAKKNGTY